MMWSWKDLCHMATPIFLETDRFICPTTVEIEAVFVGEAISLPPSYGISNIK